MTDIVKRLRDPYYATDPTVLEKAADEIERLRAKAQSRYELLRECQSELRAMGATGLVETIDAALQPEGKAEAVAWQRDHYKKGLETLATTFYKEEQHQDYAKHILDTAALQREGKTRPVDEIFSPKKPLRKDANGNTIPWDEEHDYFMAFDPANPDLPMD